MACAEALTTSVDVLLHASGIVIDDYLPPKYYHNAFGGILKIAIERLDNVRSEAGRCVRKWLSLSLSEGVDPFRIHGSDLMNDLFLQYVSVVGSLR